MHEAAAAPTAAAVLQDAVAELRAAGIAAPQRVARELLGAVLGQEPGLAWIGRHQEIAASDAAAFQAGVARVCAGEPLAYALGSQAFRSLHLAVDRRVLIPRPETEGLLELVFAWARARWGAGPWGTVADVGTGSGCIALSLAAEGAFATVVGTDVSADALAVARTNAAGVPAGATRVEWRSGNLLDPLAGAQFDIIVSNPPYVSETEWAGLEPGVRAFEPRGALVSAEEGSAHTRALLEGAPTVLAPGGLLALEIDARRAGVAVQLARRAQWQEPVVRDDVFGRPRFLLATREWS
jgi:release factor glutamine methyltransferase